MKLQAAMELAARTLMEQLQTKPSLTSPGAVRDLLRLKLAGLPHEVFVRIQFDAQHRVVAVEELFRGTQTQTSVYPREVVKASLRANAAAVIFAYNHPSGAAQPSLQARAKHAMKSSSDDVDWAHYSPRQNKKAPVSRPGPWIW